MQSAVALILTLVIAGCSNSGPPLARVRHLTRLKIVESNNVALRPGSVYDAITYFESYFDPPTRRRLPRQRNAMKNRAKNRGQTTVFEQKTKTMACLLFCSGRQTAPRNGR
jgi:hypothetical protein